MTGNLFNEIDCQSTDWQSPASSGETAILDRPRGRQVSNNGPARKRRLARWLNRLDCLRHPVITLVAVGLSAGACGWLLHPNAFLVLYAALAACGVGLAWPWLSLLGVRGELRFDRARCQEGDEVAAQLVLRNRAPWSVWGLALEGLDGATEQTDGEASSLGAAECPRNVVAAFMVPVVPAWSQREFRWEFVPARRGPHPLSEPRLVCGFPFGLTDARRKLAIGNRLLVWPRTYPVAAIPDVAYGRALEGAVLRNQVGTSGDVAGVRPYRRGDWLRRIHWGQTARHDQLIVCEFQSRAVPSVQIVLDVDPRAHAGCGSNGSREWAIRVAASFISGWLADGAEIALVLGRRTIRFGAGPDHERRLLDALAELPFDATEDSGDPPIDEVLARAECAGFDGGLQLVIATDRALRLVNGPGGADDWRRTPSQATRGRVPGTRAGIGFDKRRRFVLLRAGAFAGTHQPAAAETSAAPSWILIDDASEVPATLRGRRRVCRGDE